MSDDSGEGNEPARGKTPTREEPGRVGERPDTGPGISASQTRPGERGGTKFVPDPLHGLAAPRGRRSAQEGVPPTTEGGECRSRWGDGCGLRAEPGCQYPGSLRTGSLRTLPASAGTSHLHPESRRWETAPRYTDAGCIMHLVQFGLGDGMAMREEFATQSRSLRSVASVMVMTYGRPGFLLCAVMRPPAIQ